MGAAQCVRTVSTKLWHKVRPRRFNAYLVRRDFVLKKFDRVVRVLDLTRQQGESLYDLFSTVDADFSGDVDIWEFADFYKVTLSLFIQRLFKKLDLHRKGGLFFGEFLFSIWNLGTLSHKELLVFVFNLYDETHNGLMPQATMRKIILEMYELDLKVDERVPNYLLKMVDHMFQVKKAKEQTPYATIENFAKFAVTYPEFFKHALDLQKTIVSKTLEPGFWKQVKDFRERMGIAYDPQSFMLYLKDLGELSNEKNVTRLKGDADSDLGDYVAGDSDGSGSEHSETSEGGGHIVTVVKVKLNRRKVRQRMVASAAGHTVTQAGTLSGQPGQVESAQSTCRRASVGEVSLANPCDATLTSQAAMGTQLLQLLGNKQEASTVPRAPAVGVHVVTVVPNLAGDSTLATAPEHVPSGTARDSTAAAAGNPAGSGQLPPHGILPAAAAVAQSKVMRRLGKRKVAPLPLPVPAPVTAPSNCSDPSLGAVSSSPGSAALTRLESANAHIPRASILPPVRARFQTIPPLLLPVAGSAKPARARA